MPDKISRKKAKIQAKGIQIPQDLIIELETKFNAPSIRTGRLVLCLESFENTDELIPVFIINGKYASKSPLRMVKNNSKYEIWEGNEKYTEVRLIPRPRFYNQFTSDGVPMSNVGVIVAPGHMRSVINQNCFYYEISKPCKFCAVRYWWNSKIQKTPTQICETTIAGFKENVIKHVSLTTATINTRGKGLEGLVKTAELISSRAEIPIMIEFEPPTDYSLLDSLLQEAKAVGVTTAFSNIECFDEHIRGEVMPAKGKVEIATYIKTWEKCLDIFGKNEVYTVVVVGIGEDDNSILQGIEMAASNGVITFLVPHSPAIGAIFEDMDPPDYERMLYLYENAVNIYRKYGLDLWASKAGCARGGAFSTIKEVDRFGI
jgi:radical SAM protein (TIGR04043 family)